jgi:hypothetical protein
MQPGASGHYGALPHLGCVSGVGAVKSLDLLVRGKSPQARWLSVNTWGMSVAGSDRDEGLLHAMRNVRTVDVAIRWTEARFWCYNDDQDGTTAGCGAASCFSSHK